MRHCLLRGYRMIIPKLRRLQASRCAVNDSLRAIKSGGHGHRLRSTSSPLTRRRRTCTRILATSCSGTLNTLCHFRKLLGSFVLITSPVNTTMIWLVIEISTEQTDIAILEQLTAIARFHHSVRETQPLSPLITYTLQSLRILS